MKPIVISKEAQKLARQWKAKGEGSLRDIECGLHSKIPICCIFFYVKVWIPNIRAHCSEFDLVYYYHNLMTQFFGRNPDTKMSKGNYISCPTCVMNKSYTEIKRCKCSYRRPITKE